MRSQLTPSQFIYGKLVGNSHEYGLVAWTEDLDSYQEQLLDLVEVHYHFWGSHGFQGSGQAVGICPNNTGILRSKEKLLLHVSPATDEQGNPLTSGGRAFVQYRFIFIEQSSIDQFNNYKGLLLGNLIQETIPFFYESPSDEKSWSKFNPEDFCLETQVTYEEKEQFFLSQKPFLTQSLSTILNGKRLLITNDDPSVHPLKFLDHLLCWLPKSYGNKLSIAFGSIDENECNWADLIVKTNGIPQSSLPTKLVWIDRSGSQFRFNQKKGIENKFVKNFIDEPIENKWIRPSTILQHLDTVDSDDFNPNHPSLPFIFRYPVDSRHYEKQKASLLCEFSSEVSDQIQTFLSDEIHSFESTKLDKILSSLWQVFREDTTNNSLILEAIINIRPLKFLEILKSNPFEDTSILLNNYFSNVLGKLKTPDDLAALKQACFKAIVQQDVFEKKMELLSLYRSHSSIFTEDECFHLSISTLTKDVSFEHFKVLFKEHIVYYLPNLDETTFRKSDLYSYLKIHSSSLVDHLYSLFQLKLEGGLEFLPFIARELGMNSPETKKLYTSFLMVWQPSFCQGLPIIISCIEHSIENDLTFQFQPFLEVYKYFETQIETLIPALSRLTVKPNYWPNWRNLFFVLNSSRDRSVMLFFDKFLSERFCFETLELWLKLLTNSSNSIDLENDFLNGKNWRLLDEDTIKKNRSLLTSTYSQYIPQLITWAVQTKPDLVNGVLLDVLETVWMNGYSIEQALWDLLSKDSMLYDFGNKYWMKLLFIKINLKPSLFLPSPKTLLSDDEKEIIYQHIGGMSSKLNNSKKTSQILHDCSIFGLRPLAILKFVTPEACSLRLMSQYLTQAKEEDKGDIPDCLRLLTKVSTFGKDEEEDKVRLMFNCARQMISTIPQQYFQKESLEIIVNFLSSQY